jgi:hypothetical protein
VPAEDLLDERAVALDQRGDVADLARDLSQSKKHIKS